LTQHHHHQVYLYRKTIYSNNNSSKKINTKKEFATGKLQKDLAVIKSSSHQASEIIFYAYDICIGLNLCPVWATKNFSFINSAKEGTFCNGF